MAGQGKLAPPTVVSVGSDNVTVGLESSVVDAPSLQAQPKNLAMVPAEGGKNGPLIGCKAFPSRPPSRTAPQSPKTSGRI